MGKVVCQRMKGRQLNTSFGQFQFDQQGIAEVPDEHVNKLLALSGYQLVGSKPTEPEKGNNQEDNPGVQNDAENKQVDKTSDNEENDHNDEKNDAEQTEEDEEQTEEDEEQTEETEHEEPAKGGKPAITLEYLNSKNVAQLKKIAKDNEIDLAGATKKDEIIPIIFGAMNQ